MRFFRSFHEKSEKKQVCGLIILAALTLLLIIHSRYGFCQSDEPFYISLAHRLYLGQKLIKDEWHPTQFFSPILLLFYNPYRFLNGTVDGIIRFFRIVYIVLSGIISCWLYISLRRDYSGAIIPAIICLLFLQGNIQGMSYYSLCFLSVIGLMTSIREAGYYIRHNRNIVLLAIIGGICASVAVLCNPYLVFAIIVIILANIITMKHRKYSLYICVTIFVVAIIYISYVFWGLNIEDIKKNLPYILSDPQHTMPVFVKLTMSLQAQREWMPLKLVIIEVGFVLIIFFLRKRVKNNINFVYVICMCVLMISMIRPVIELQKSICYIIVLSFSWGGIPLIIVDYLERRDKTMVMWYVCGWFVVIAFFMASNTILAATTVGYCICSIPILLTVFRLVSKGLKCSRSNEKIIAVAGLVVLVTIVVAFTITRTFGIYRDSELNKLNVELKYGPAKGVYTSKEHAQQYYDIYSSIIEILENNNENDIKVFHSAKLPWAYLCSDCQYASPTSWTTPLNQDNLVDYYSLHPENYPNIIFLYAEDVGAYDAVRFNGKKGDSNPNENITDVSAETIFQKYGNKYTSRFVKVFER